eukprot:scaffold2703_cov129-Isochrysis_galbana.AAC.8
MKVAAFEAFNADHTVKKPTRYPHARRAAFDFFCLGTQGTSHPCAAPGARTQSPPLSARRLSRASPPPQRGARPFPIRPLPNLCQGARCAHSRSAPSPNCIRVPDALIPDPTLMDVLRVLKRVHLEWVNGGSDSCAEALQVNNKRTLSDSQVDHRALEHRVYGGGVWERGRMLCR